MKPELQRIAIAEACGNPEQHWWCPRCEREVSPQCVRFNETHDMEGCGCPVIWITAPDYLNDLNAMHEAEKVFYADGKQSERYAEFLLDVLQIPHAFVGTARSAFLTNHATAEQRAEAFLRTIGKWTE